MALHCQIALPRGQSSNRILGFSILLLILEWVTSEMRKGLKKRRGPGDRDYDDEGDQFSRRHIECKIKVKVEC